MRLPNAIRWAAIHAAVLIAGLGPAVAEASEVLLSGEPIATDKQGRITAKARQRTSSVVPSTKDGRRWTANLWAELDDPRGGPLTLTVYGKLPDGRRYIAALHRLPDYAGERFVSTRFELAADAGAELGQSYTVELSQLSLEGHLHRLAGTRITLGDQDGQAPGAESPPEPEAEGTGTTNDTDTTTPELDKSDRTPSSTMGRTREHNDASPPPLAKSNKRGCQVFDGLTTGHVLAFGLLGFGRRRAGPDAQSPT